MVILQGRAHHLPWPKFTVSYTIIYYNYYNNLLVIICAENNVQYARVRQEAPVIIWALYTPATLLTSPTVPPLKAAWISLTSHSQGELIYSVFQKKRPAFIFGIGPNCVRHQPILIRFGMQHSEETCCIFKNFVYLVTL